MTPERWQQIGRIFMDARDREPDGRAAFLEQACRGDDELRLEVEALLSSDERAGSFMEASPLTETGLTGPASKVGPILGQGSDPFLGRVVSNYRLEERIAAGGMGVLYRATDLKLGRSVAVKVLSRQLALEETAKARFLREARAASALDHPNIGNIHHVEDQDGELFIVMALYQGETLKQRLQKGPLPVPKALDVLRQVALGLEAAHRAGIIHRDIKPANLIRTDEGLVKILDFGLAKLASEVQATTVTQTGEAMGTVLYMSPEQLCGAAVDGRSDLWSFGVVAYELLAGVTPFQGDSGAATVWRILSEEPPALASVPGVPGWLAELVTQLLRKAPAERPQSASEVLSRLDRRPASQDAVPPSFPHRIYGVPAALLVLVIIAAPVWFYYKATKRQWAIEQAVPQIIKLKDEGKSLAAFLLLRKAEHYAPGNSQLARLGEEATRVVSIDSSPPGATVDIQDYLSPESDWFRLGITRLDKIHIPVGYFRWRVSLLGRQYIAAPPTAEVVSFSLDSMQKAPDGMVWIRGARWEGYIDFLGWLGPYELPAFFMDRFEVTNRQYKEFIDNRGYQRREYWTRTFLRDGRELSFEQAMALFRDATGRPGPSTWQAGHYPDGQDNYPVSGISWYEASAYAAWSGKSLPAIAQWYQAAPPGAAWYTVQQSNFSNSKVAPVGQSKGVGPYGTYDMAGNVREWCENEVGQNLRFTLGGAWNSPTYLYTNPQALSPLDRTSTNGFRTVQNIGTLPKEVTAPLTLYVRDFSKEKPAPDEVFRAYRSLYAYGPTPLNSKLEAVDENSPDWRREKVTFDAAYGGERIPAYLFLPKNVRPPLQTVVFFPSVAAFFIPNSENLGDMQFVDYVIQSGRAVLYPIYQGTYERRRRLALPGTPAVSERLVQWSKEVGRSVDYLETRADIDKSKLAYLGVSMGTAYGLIFTALEDRFKTVIFIDGGYFLMPARPPYDQVDFAPRLRKPVLMVNGRYDFVFSFANSQLPMFQMLGTEKTHKRHVLLETDHNLTSRRAELVKEVLAWLDKYLGKVD